MYKYLYSRGLSSDTIIKWNITLGTEDILNQIKDIGIKGLEPFFSFLQHNPPIYYVLLPIIDVYGKLSSIVGRKLPTINSNEAPRYLYPTHATIGNMLYGINYAKHKIIETDYVICVEGTFDTILSQQVGLDNTVGILTNRISDTQSLILLRYCKNIILLFDRGQEINILSHINRLNKFGIKTHSIIIPSDWEGKDPADWFSARGDINVAKQRSDYIKEYIKCLI
jgi:DNA primase